MQVAKKTARVNIYARGYGLQCSNKNCFLHTSLETICTVLDSLGHGDDRVFRPLLGCASRLDDTEVGQRESWRGVGKLGLWQGGLQRKRTLLELCYRWPTLSGSLVVREEARVRICWRAMVCIPVEERCSDESDGRE